MAVGELVLGAFITVLVEKLASSELISLARSEGIDSQLTKWNYTLIQIQALLADAGKKIITNHSVKVWLVDLQHLAYDIDNVLDDLATEALRRKLNKESHASTSTNTVRKIIPACCANFTPRNIRYGRKMSSNLDEITTRLNALVARTNFLGLIANVEVSVGTSRPLEQTSLVDESEIVGREGDKEALLAKLLGNDSCDEKVGVVAIVGMGGIGKTTLANLLYNEEKVKEHFEVRAWVCVSDELDEFNITKAIFKDVGGEDKNFENLNQVQLALREKLSQKKFLVLLDDVWNKDRLKWEVFQRPFRVGAPGSKIIVTTRNTEVATVVDCDQPYDLGVLSNEEALSLFAQNALGKPDFDLYPSFRLLGEGIVKKCDRLPLALKLLGKLCGRKNRVDEWEELLNDEIWKSRDESNVLPALELSYNDLPPHLKRMFAYCSLFLKDYVFDRDELVLLWMAEGFLKPSKDRQTMENLGRKSFDELKSRSFFQTKGKAQHTMHDLINDLATSVASEFFFRAGDDDELGNEDFNKVHHFSFNAGGLRGFGNFKALHRARRLRTLLPMSLSGYSWPIFYLSGEVLAELLPCVQFLRVLSLSNFEIKEIPQSIGSLKHIRYLNFSYTCIKCLPEEVSDLYNLQSLLLRSCSELSKLPRSFVKLINLRHLDISNTPRLDKIPLGIGGLTSLQTLSKVIIEEANGFKLSELKDLSDLQGQLSIQRLGNVINATHAKEAELHQKEGLDDLEMEWSYCDVSRNETTAYKVLEGLRPHDKLRKLKILFYNGREFPSWVVDPSFDQLTELTLFGLNLRSSPEGCFAHLTSLSIAECEEIESIPEKGFGFLPFLCLRYLRITYCENLKSFPHEHLQGLTSLKYMTILSCPSMDYSFPCGSWPPNLSVLYIGGLKKPMSEWGCQNFPTSLVRLELDGRKSGVVSFAKEEDVMNSYNITTSSSFLLPPSLTTLAINGFEDLESVSEGLQHLTYLKKLRIWKCPKVRDLPETLLGSLSSLGVFYCPTVEERYGDRKGDYWPIVSRIHGSFFSKS